MKPKTLKIAYLMLCHTDPEHIHRLCTKLTADADVTVYIHVDAKTEEMPFREKLNNNPQVHFLSKRFPIYWAGWNSVLATIALMKEALESGADRYVILQGLDYPIFSNRQIKQFFTEHADTEFIKAVNCTRSKIIPNYKLCYGYWFMDKGGLFTSVMARLTKYPNTHGWKYRRGYYRYKGKKMEVYRGWAHIALTKSCVSYLLDFYRNNPKFNRYFKHVFAQDECYFHTIIYNSPFAGKTVLGKATEDTYVYTELMNLTYYEYPKYAVTVFKRREDYERLKQSGCLYFRKATSESKELLDYIDTITASAKDSV